MASELTRRWRHIARDYPNSVLEASLQTIRTKRDQAPRQAEHARFSVILGIFRAELWRRKTW